MGLLGKELLQPSSQYYSRPGAGTEAAKVHATKEASYLSSMDQFYAELDEMTRQFDLSLGLKDRMFGLEEDKFGLEQERFGLEGEKFEFDKEQTDETSELEWFKAQTGRIEARDRGDYYQSYADIGYKDLAQKEFNPDDMQQILDMYKKSSAGGNVTPQAGTPGGAQYSNESSTWKGGPVSITDWTGRV